MGEIERVKEMEEEGRVEEGRVEGGRVENDNGMLREYVGRLEAELEEGRLRGEGGRREEDEEIQRLREENLGLQERLDYEIRGKNDAKNGHLVFKGKIKEFQQEKLCQIDVLSCEN